MQHGKLAIFRTEIMPPLRHTMRFIDRKQGNTRTHLYLLEQIQKMRHEQALWCHIENLQITV